MQNNIQKEYVFTEDEMRLIINSLDLYSRIWMGQYDHLLWPLQWKYEYESMEDHEQTIYSLLLKIRSILLPGLNKYHNDIHVSYGIFSPDIDFKAGTAYDMQQVFRYTLAYFNHPEGGITVDFKSPLFAESDPYPAPTAKCFNCDEKVYEKIQINDDQKSIIKTSLEISNALDQSDIKTVFTYYTDDMVVLSLAQDITNILKTVNPDTRFSSEKNVYEPLIQKLN